MKNPLIINIRCSCIEEYVNIQKLHKEYTKQLRSGEIMSVFVGSELAVPGEYKVVDELLAKKSQARFVPSVAFSNRPVVREEVTGAQGNADGTVTETVERVVRPSGSEIPQAVDGGVDAMGNPPLPEKPLTLDEARAIGAGYAEQEEELAYAEEPVPDSMWKEEPKPAVEPKPEITLTDVLVAQAEADDPLEAIKTEAEGEPDGADWNTYAG